VIELLPGVYAAYNWQGVLDLHNSLRSRHRAAPLAWDAGVAAYAQNYANRCIWGHNPDARNYGLGENLALGHRSLRAAVQAWYDEVGCSRVASVGVLAQQLCHADAVWCSVRASKTGINRAPCIMCRIPSSRALNCHEQNAFTLLAPHTARMQLLASTGCGALLFQQM
jgi:hypothetical protein